MESKENKENKALKELDDSLTRELFKYETIVQQVKNQLIENRNKFEEAFEEAKDFTKDFTKKYSEEFAQLQSLCQSVPGAEAVESQVQTLFFRLFNGIRSTTVETKILLCSRWNSNADMKLCVGKNGFGIRRKIIAHAITDLSRDDRAHYFKQIIKNAPEICNWFRANRLHNLASKLENFALILGKVNKDKNGDLDVSGLSDLVVVKLENPLSYVHVRYNYGSEITGCISIHSLRLDVSEAKRGRWFEYIGENVKGEEKEFYNIGFSFDKLDLHKEKVFERVTEMVTDIKNKREIIVTNIQNVFAKELLALDL